MKRFILLLFVFLSAQACSNNSTFLLDATTNHDDGKKVYLIKVGSDNSPNAVDSTEVIEGKFSFTDSILVQFLVALAFFVKSTKIYKNRC